MGSEKNFEMRIKRFLEDQEAYWVKYFANAYTKAGIPDLLCCVNGHFVAVEVKAQTGKASPLQIYNCNRIRQTKGIAVVLYPSGFEQFKELIHRLKRDESVGDIPLIMK